MRRSSIKVVAEQIVSDRGEIPEKLSEASDELYVEMKENLPKKIKKWKRNWPK